MIVAEKLRKTFGSTVAVDDLSFTVEPGHVTGFLGPNGAGKSTAMRCIIGLDHLDGGRATVNGRPYRDLRFPAREVGVLLDAGYVHPARTARNHLRWIAAASGLPLSTVGAALERVGLEKVARKRVKTFSLGMKQRLGLAAALLGDPKTLILDEPVNGLDPEGIQWVRTSLRHLAAEGRAVLVSSHMLSEMQLMADHLVVIGRGRLIDQGSVDDFVRRYARSFVTVRSPELDRLVRLLAENGAAVRPGGGGEAEIEGIPPARIGELAAAAGIVLHELAPRTASLEEAFLGVTAGDVEYRSEGGPVR